MTIVGELLRRDHRHSSGESKRESSGVRVPLLERNFHPQRVVCFFVVRFLYTGQGRERDFLNRPLQSLSVKKRRVPWNEQAPHVSIMW